jgi:hypothetical protein
MKFLKYIIVVLHIISSLNVCYTQSTDHNHYQNRYDDCNNKHNELKDKLNKLKNEKKTIIDEFREGLFCSDCKRGKTQIEKSGENFSKHIQDGARNGRHVVPATPAEIAKKEDEYNQKIHDAEIRVDSQRLDCEGIQQNYQQAQQRAQQEAQQKANEEAQARADAQAEAWRNQQEEERLRQVELLRQKELALQAYLAEQQRIRDELEANNVQFRDALDQNNAYTQDRLDEYNQNSELGDIEYDNTKEIAQNRLNSLSTDNMKNEAFGNNGFLSGNNNIENEDTYSGNVIEHYVNKLVDYGRDKLAEASPLFDNIKEVQSKFANLKSNLKVFEGIRNGEINKEMVDKAFSFYPNSIPNEHRKHQLHVSVDLGNRISTTITNTYDNLFSENLEDEAEKFNAYFTSNPKIESEPLSKKDYMVAARAVVGGAFFIVAGGPAWVAIGGAAWYVFKN